MGIAHDEFIERNATDYHLLITEIERLREDWVKELIEEDANSESNVPSNLLYHIYDPVDVSAVICGRDGQRAIEAIAERLVEFSPNSHDLSKRHLVEIISHNVLRIRQKGFKNDSELTEILLSYVTDSRETHRSKSYHFTCTLTHAKSPGRFLMGPVAFQLAEYFSAEMAKSIENGSLEIEQEVAQKFEERAMRHGWIASVQIPPCGADVSRKRAENTIELAVALMKVFFGIPHSKGMRLPHVAAHRDSEAYLLVQEGSQVTWRWEGSSLEAALVADGWLDQIHEVYKHAVAHLLHESTLGLHSEVAARIGDATRWYNDVSFESAAGVQVVKLVAALERLTVTGQFDIHKFCKRVALLASTSDKEEEIAEAYRRARQAHRLRNEVMHGTASQSDPKFLKDVLMVHDLTRYALMTSLEMYLGFGGSRKSSKEKHLRSFFVDKEKPLLKTFHTVRQEFPTPKGTHVVLDSDSEQVVRRELERGAFAEASDVVAYALRSLRGPAEGA